MIVGMFEVWRRAIVGQIFFVSTFVIRHRFDSPRVCLAFHCLSIANLGLIGGFVPGFLFRVIYTTPV